MIGQTKDIIRYAGLYITEHQAPAGALIMEMKQCENCPMTFMRPIPAQHCDQTEGRTLGRRYCRKCLERYLIPESMDDYKAQLPTEAEQKHAHHLPKYDNSLEVGHVFSPLANARVPQRRSHESSLGRVARTAAAFRFKPEMTAREICEAAGYDPKYPSQAVAMLKVLGVPIISCGFAERTSCMGPARKLYRLQSVN